MNPARPVSHTGFRILILILIVSTFPHWSGAQAEPLHLRAHGSHVLLDPATLELQFAPTGRSPLHLSHPSSEVLAIADLRVSADRVDWRLADLRISASIQLNPEILVVRFAAESPGRLTFPRIQDPAVRAWSIPIDEGVFVPAGEAPWIQHLVEISPLDTTAGLGLPFLGLQYQEVTLSAVLVTPFHNAIQFRETGDRLAADITHTFPPFPGTQDYEVRFRLGDPSPITAALHYREWLMQRGEWVGLAEKIRRTPAAAQLPGAAHIYLWGEEPLADGDILDWKRLLSELNSPRPTAQGIRNLLPPAQRKTLADASGIERPDRYQRSQVREVLNAVLSRVDLYAAGSWTEVALPDEIRGLDAGVESRRPAGLWRLNSALLSAALPGCLAPSEQWGDGVSPKMIRRLMAAGFDRLWLGSGSWDGFLRRPEMVSLARSHGYLIGPYDSYHSIHRPDEPDTWPTAQFDGGLYESGAITDATGKKLAGFRKKGHLLSPLVTQAWVERRVRPLMSVFAANSWFMDCDGFGQYFDDYSAGHRASQADDVAARIRRMVWIRDQFGAVVGTEGCSAPVASAIHFAHGVMTPTLGWGDPDMKDRASPYYVGAYHPPEEPAVFFKSIPLKEPYHRFHFDPRFRLPLFQAVFHDSVVATHHWGSGSFKYRDETSTTRLLELLYAVPPLWHLNLAELERRQSDLQAYYRRFSPLQRELALLPLTAFAWLTPERDVQRTTFGNRVEVTANFGQTEFQLPATALPARSLHVLWRDTGKTAVFTHP